MIVGAYIGNIGKGSNALALDDQEMKCFEPFHDVISDLVVVLKKKLCIRVDEEHCESDHSAGRQLESGLRNLQMCFAGRLVAIPRGQPLSVFKSKMKVPSSYFKSLGVELIGVPIGKQNSPDMAVRSPVFCPAWQIKPSKTKPSLMFRHIDVVLPGKLGFGSEIDLSLPVLVPDDTPQETTKVKTVKNGKEVRMVGFDLSRPLTEMEVAEGVAKGEAKTAQETAKARRTAILEEHFEPSPTERSDEQQLSIPASFLRHVLR